MKNLNKGIFLLLPRRPKRPCPLVVPAMTAAFLDENLPDGTRLRPGTKFIKYWKMRNTGTLSWSAETKVKSQTAVCFCSVGSLTAWILLRGTCTRMRPARRLRAVNIMDASMCVQHRRDLTVCWPQRRNNIIRPTIRCTFYILGEV